MKFSIATIVVIAATLTNAIAIAEPEARLVRTSSVAGRCGLRGGACMNKRDAEAEARLVRTSAIAGRCGLRGGACMKPRSEQLEMHKREAIAEAIADPEARLVRTSAIAGRCGLRGGACMTKREAEIAEDVANEVADAMLARREFTGTDLDTEETETEE